jgi:hypothetical protein
VVHQECLHLMFVQIWAFAILVMLLECSLRSRAPTLGQVGRRLVSDQPLQGEDMFLQDVDEASLTMVERSRRCPPDVVHQIRHGHISAALRAGQDGCRAYDAPSCTLDRRYLQDQKMQTSSVANTPGAVEHFEWLSRISDYSGAVRPGLWWISRQERHRAGAIVSTKVNHRSFPRRVATDIQD